MTNEQIIKLCSVCGEEFYHIEDACSECEAQRQYQYECETYQYEQEQERRKHEMRMQEYNQAIKEGWTPTRYI